MPVAAVADTVVTSAASFRTIALADDVPENVCVPVKVLFAEVLNPAAGVVDAHVVPLLVSTLPDDPGATTCTADVPLPKMTLLAVKLVAPVPPLATFKVPARVTVPALVTGPPLVVRPVVPPDTSTLVTEPEPGPVNAI